MQINKVSLPLALALRQIGKRVKIRGWERLLRILFHPDKQQCVAFNIPFSGYTYPAYADSIVDWNALFYGTYEAFDLGVLAEISRCIKDAVIVDIGANVGHHALYMAAHSRQVHAFEPNPALWPLIEEKISANGLDNLRLHKFGLGAKANQLPLYLSSESGEASLLAGVSRTSLSAQVPAQIVRGDDCFAENGIDRLDIVKIDIEGFEKYAIEGIRAHLDTWRPFMMVELSESGREQFGGFMDFVKAFPEGYKFYFSQLTTGLIIRTTMRAADEMAYDHYTGNVFCIPEERTNIFIEIAGDTIAHGSHSPTPNDHY